MQLRKLISSALLFAVVLAPTLGLACVSAARCRAHCAMTDHHAKPGASKQEVPSPAVPCCQRKAAMPAAGEPSAQIVAPVQIGPMLAASPVAMAPAMLTFRVAKLAAPPQLFPPLLLLCTLLI